MPVVVVTDASARLPADLLDKWAIRVVPLHILLDGVDLRDGVDDIPDDVYKRPRHHRGGHTGRTGRRLPAGAGRQRRRRCGGGAHFLGVVGNLRRRRDGPRPTSTRPCGLSTRSPPRWAPALLRWPPRGPRPPAATWTPSRMPRVRPCAAVTRSWWCTGWTTCAAAGGSVAPRRGWAPRWRSSRCCASMTANSFWPNGCAPPTKRRRR